MQEKRPDNEYQVCSYRLEENARNDTNGTLCPQEWDTPKKNGTLQ